MATIQVSRTCFRCNQTSEIEVDAEGYRRWREEGVFIQDALPEVPAGYRELLLSGTCDACFSIIRKARLQDYERTLKERGLLDT